MTTTATSNAPGPPPPTIHVAELASGPSGVVIQEQEIDLATALALRRQQRNIVVCGDDLKANRALAHRIESALGPCLRHEPHRLAGLRALPHFQQRDANHGGHTFYETPHRRAIRRRP